MPTYAYGCKECKKEFDVIKSFSEFNNPEFCPGCKSGNVERFISRTSFYGASDWDKVSYNPGLGVVTKNAKHAAKIAKARGLIEVGNDSCENIMSGNAQERASAQESAFEESFAPMQHHLKKSMEG